MTTIGGKKISELAYLGAGYSPDADMLAVVHAGDTYKLTSHDLVTSVLGTVVTGYSPSGTFNGTSGVATKNDTTTFTPTTGGVGGTAGQSYYVTTAGSFSLDGTTSWAIGDLLLNAGSAWVRVRLSLSLGTMSAQNSVSVSITGGSIDSLTTIGLSDGYTLAPYDAVTLGYVHVTTDEDGSISAGITDDGTHVFGKVDVRSGSGAFDTVAIAGGTAVLSSITDGGGNVTTAQDPRASYQYLHSWDDGAGYITAGILVDGTFHFSRARIDNIEIDTLALTSVTADLATVTTGTFGGATFEPLDTRVPDTAWAVTDPDGNIALSISLSGILRAAPSAKTLGASTLQQNFVRLGHIQTRRFSNNYNLGSTSGQTWASVWGLAAPFDAVRLVYATNGTGACTVKGSVAASASLNNGINPLDESGGAVTAVAVTFNNGGVDLSLWEQYHRIPQPAAVTSLALNPVPAGATLFATISDGLGYEEEVKTYSDWIPLRSFTRTDGGTLPLLMVRTYMTGSPRPGTSGPSTGWETAARGRILRCFVNAGDCVATPASFTSTTVQGECVPTEVRFMTRARGLTIAVAGDSCLQGITSNAGANNFVFQAATALSTATLPIEVLNLGKTSMSYPGWFWNIEDSVTVSKPQIVVIQGGSRNGGGYVSAAAAEAVWQHVMALMARVRAYGGVPILMTPWPDSSETAPTDLNRLILVANCLQAGLGGTPVIDANAMVGVAGTPMTLNAAYSSDGVHLTDAGHAYLATALTPILQQILGLI